MGYTAFIIPKRAPYAMMLDAGVMLVESRCAALVNILVNSNMARLEHE